MKRFERVRSRAAYVVVALVACLLVDAPQALGQEKSGSTAPPKVSQERTTTTTSPDGLTTTTTTQGKDGYGYDIRTTVVTTTDKDHIVQSVVTTTYDDVPVSGTARTTDTKKYNQLGGYSETIDYTWTGRAGYDTKVLTTHDELQCDAAGNVLSGTSVRGGSDVIGKGPERAPYRSTRLTWDAGTKKWTYSEGTSWTPAQSGTSTASKVTGQIIAPPVASPGTQMMLSYQELAQLPSLGRTKEYGFTISSLNDKITLKVDFYAVDAQPLPRAGAYYADKVLPDPTILSFYLNLPATATSVSVFKKLDGDGKPDALASVTTVSSNAPVPGMNLPSAPAPADQPAIVASAGAYDVHAGTITVQTQNTSVGDTLQLETGQPLTTLAASDRSMVAALPSNISLGRHQLSLEQLLAPQSVYPESVPFDAISLVVDPMPPVEEVGDTATPTVHVMGMPAGDAAEMEFLIGGSAELAGGGTYISVPVVGNVASCTIVGVRSGEALVRFHLRLVSMAATPQ